MLVRRRVGTDLRDRRVDRRLTGRAGRNQDSLLDNLGQISGRKGDSFEPALPPLERVIERYPFGAATAAPEKVLQIALAGNEGDEWDRQGATAGLDEFATFSVSVEMKVLSDRWPESHKTSSSRKRTMPS